MIKSFKHKGLEDLFRTGNRSGVDAHLVPKLRDILDHLDAAFHVRDMGFPGANLHPWQGVKNVWSVDVNGNWRVVFKYKNGVARDVILIDPH